MRREHAQRVLAVARGALTVDEALARRQVRHRLEVPLPDLIHHVAADIGPTKDFLNFSNDAGVHSLPHIASSLHHPHLDLSGRELLAQRPRHPVTLRNGLVL
ncbi:hypothetical protein D3C87_1887870 [compost metagenome]